MKSQTRRKLAVFGGTAMLAAAGVGLGGGQSVSSATPTTTPEPAPASVVAPKSATPPPADAPNGCIPGGNCGPVQPRPHP